MTPVFDKDGLAIQSGNIFCYYYDPITKEYTGWSDEFIHVGVSMPGSSTDIEPSEQKEGFTLVFDGESWLEMEDHRGEVVYSTENGMESKVDHIGPLKDGFTIKPPSSDFDKWDGDDWVADNDARKQADIADAENKRSYLISQANDYMNSRQWPGKAATGRLNDPEKNSYNLWLDYLDDIYSADTSAAPDIEWPLPPQ